MGGGASLAAAIYTKTLQNYRRTISNFCAVRLTVFDREVLAFDVARFLQPFAERRHEKSGRFWKSRVEEPNHRRESSPFHRLLNTCADRKSRHDGFFHTFTFCQTT